VILVSGRPMIVTDWLDQADALIAAWLPGTEGQGVADVLFGDAPFTGRLPYTWPRSMDQIPFDFSRLSASGPRSPLYPYGYGLGSDGAPLHKDEPGLQLF
jgi:beta-glucosidase